MKLLKNIILLFLLLTGIAAACPDKEFHEKIERYINVTTS